MNDEVAQCIKSLATIKNRVEREAQPDAVVRNDAKIRILRKRKALLFFLT